MIYVSPEALWEQFEANKTCLGGHYLICAESEETGAIRLSVEDGELLLLFDDYLTGETTYEGFADEESAVEAYVEMLSWLPGEEPDVLAEDPPDEEDPPVFTPQILAATAAWLCVATGKKPEELDLAADEIENAAWLLLEAVESDFDLGGAFID